MVCRGGREDVITTPAVHPVRAAGSTLLGEVAALAGFCAFLFLYGLGSFGLIGADEPRYAQIAREMLARHDWITPTLNGAPWLEKPALYYWGAMLSYRVFGVSDWAARLPSALAATAMVGAIYVFMRRFRPGSQIDAALITASAAGTVGFARAASTDMAMTSVFVMAMLAWYAWLRAGHRAYLAAFYALMALGTLAKGPVAPFLAGLIVVLFALVRREARLIVRTLWWPALALFLVIALPWYVAVQLKTGNFFQVFILQHNLERFGTDVFRHHQPLWYYAPVLVLGLLPWTVYALAAMVEGIRGWHSAGNATPGTPEGADQAAGREFRIFLLLWAAAPLVFFSLSQSKLPGYILPALMPLAMLLADYIRQSLASGRRCSFVLTLAHAAVAAALLGAALLSPYLMVRARAPQTALAVAGGAAALVFAGMAASLKAQGLRMLRFVTLVPVVLGLAFLLRVGASTIDGTLSARPIAREIARIETRQAPLAVFQAPREIEYGLNFYRNQPVQRYERGEVPAADHLVVAKAGSLEEVQKAVGSRRVSYVGGFAPQHLDYYWISPGMTMEHHHDP